MSKVLKGEGLTSLVLIILGLVLLIRPGVSAQILCGAFGVMLLIYSAVHLYRDIKTEPKTATAYGQIVFSAAGAILGIAVMGSPANVMSILPIAGGVILVLHGIQRVMQSFTLKKQNVKNWWLGLCFGLVNCLLGVVLLANPFGAVEMLFRMLGLFLVLDGAGSAWVSAGLSR